MGVCLHPVHPEECWLSLGQSAAVGRSSRTWVYRYLLLLKLPTYCWVALLAEVPWTAALPVTSGLELSCLWLKVLSFAWPLHDSSKCPLKGAVYDQSQAVGDEKDDQLVLGWILGHDFTVFTGGSLSGSARSILCLSLWKGWLLTCIACYLLPHVHSRLLWIGAFPHSLSVLCLGSCGSGFRYHC